MSKTSSLIPRVPLLLSHDNQQSSFFPKIISDSTKLFPDPSQVLSDATKLITEPAKIISGSTKLVTEPSSKILSDTIKILPNPAKILSPTNLLSGASTIISPISDLFITGPLKILSALLSSATSKLLELLMLIPLSISPRRHFLIVGAALLLLVGLAVAGTVLVLIMLLPLIVILSPVWVPASTALFVVTAGFLSMCGFVLVSVILVAWLVQHLFNALALS